LDRAKSKDYGISRIVSQELNKLLQEMVLQRPRLSISAIHRKIVMLAKRSSLKAPSYETVYSIVKKINPALLIHEPRKVQRDGIRFQGMRYIAPTLAGFVTEQITSRYGPRDLSDIKLIISSG
jgi:hypothetical protein